MYFASIPNKFITFCAKNKIKMKNSIYKLDFISIINIVKVNILLIPFEF